MTMHYVKLLAAMLYIHIMHEKCPFPLLVYYMKPWRLHVRKLMLVAEYLRIKSMLVNMVICS